MNIHAANVLCSSLVIALRTSFQLASVAIIVGLVFQIADEPPHHLDPPGSGTAHFKDRLGRIVVTVEDDERQDFAKLLIRDREGHLLLSGNIYAN